MPEREIEQLPHGVTPNSFRVLAEWLRDNRRMLEGRLDRQDKRIDTNQSALLAKLEEIHVETRRTNGRVTDLENSVEMGVALRDGREQWEHQAEAAQAREEERDEARREKRIDRLINAGLFGLGLLFGGLGHALGWF